MLEPLQVLYCLTCCYSVSSSPTRICSRVEAGDSYCVCARTQYVFSIRVSLVYAAVCRWRHRPHKNANCRLLDVKTALNSVTFNRAYWTLAVTDLKQEDTFIFWGHMKAMQNTVTSISQQTSTFRNAGTVKPPSPTVIVEKKGPEGKLEWQAIAKKLVPEGRSSYALWFTTCNIALIISIFAYMAGDYAQWLRENQALSSQSDDRQAVCFSLCLC